MAISQLEIAVGTNNKPILSVVRPGFEDNIKSPLGTAFIAGWSIPVFWNHKSHMSALGIEPSSVGLQPSVLARIPSTQSFRLHSSGKGGVRTLKAVKLAPLAGECSHQSACLSKCATWDSNPETSASKAERYTDSPMAQVK